MRKKRVGLELGKDQKTASSEVEVRGGDGVGVGKHDSTRETTTPSLIPRPNGHGALMSGGTPGNKGGGRTPEEITGTFRKIIAEKGLPWVERMLDAPLTVACPNCGTQVPPPVKDGVRARLLDTAVRSSVPQQVEHKGHVTLHADTRSLSE